MTKSTLSALVLAGLPVPCVSAAVVPFTEDFDADASNWRDINGMDTLAWFAAGGPDGGAYVSTSYTVPDSPPPFGAVVYRGQDEFGSSGGAFEGDWIADGVKEFSFFVRHDAPGPLPVFARFSGPDNFPGAAGISFAPVLPNVWTQIVIDISPGSPQIVLEGFPFEDVFSNIGHVQIGIDGVDFIGQKINIDLDKVSITPAPGATLLLALGLIPRRRRRR